MTILCMICDNNNNDSDDNNDNDQNNDNMICNV